MLLKHQYLKFAYVDIALVVSKMYRGNLTAGILAIGVTVVLILEIDTNCLTINAWIGYILSMSWYKKICYATNGRLSGGRNTEGNLRRLTVVVCCEKRSSSVGAIIFVFLVSLGKHIYLNSALIHFWWNQYAWYRKGIWWLGGMGVRVWSLKEGKNMCHTYTHYLTWQRSILTTWTGLQNAGSHWGASCCVNGVSKCKETVG